MKARREDFDLAKALRAANFTPSVRDLPALLELVAAGDERAPMVIAQLQGAREAIAARLGTSDEAIAARLGDSDEAVRARLVGALGFVARRGDRVAAEQLRAQLEDASARVRRAAIGALGKLDGDDDARAALLARWDAADATPDERRALAEALGKLGGDAALAKLRALDPGGDAELARRRDRALLIADRTANRGEESRVLDDVPPPAPVTVVLRCKPGLAPLLADELRARGFAPRPSASPMDVGRAAAPQAEPSTSDDAVAIELTAPLGALWASRLWMTAGVRVPRGPGEPAEAIARAIVAARPLLGAWTVGPIRWRLEVGAGKQRALIWRVAKLVAQLAPAGAATTGAAAVAAELVNDPTATTWDVVALPDSLELRPRRLADPRFAYRSAEVPAASHPTVAAALAFAAGARPGDRVWDPFAGSGLELVERAKLGPARSLAGTDLAEAALAAARANLAAAGVTATLDHADARAATGTADLDLVITNPPLGGRVAVDAPALLAQLLPVIARRLAPGGRLVWIAPATKRDRLAALADQLGLRTTLTLPIDLGGVHGRLERRERREP